MYENEKDSPTEEEADVGLSCTLDLFKEVNEVQEMIAEIPKTANVFILAEKGFERFKTVLDQYQEQPHLLDPHLENLLNQLVSIITNLNTSGPEMSLAFQYLWLIVKVRGYKTVIRKMPHEVQDLVLVLKLLEKDELKNDFYGSYILLMWLSIIIYLPFSLTGFDASTGKEALEKEKTITERIYSVIKKELPFAQSSREMAAYLASRFVTRPDLRDKYLPTFIDYSFEILERNNPLEPQLLFHKMGVLRSLGLIFKHGKREELLPFAPQVLTKLLRSKTSAVSDTPLRKYATKLVQRIGLTFLRPKLAPWRYHRGNRSLASNVEGVTTQTNDKSSCLGFIEEEDAHNDVPSEVEEVIDFLLRGLRDSDTIVRWSAAKGIGRVTERLPQALAGDVLAEVMELFSVRESEKAWHGGCLALAELARRGLMFPSKLSEVLPVVEKALVYDELKGQCSVGANIRDAACYLCWAFARAYHPDQLKPFVQKIATGLLVVCLFDREIPCRRAASAAFQEHVGRQGNFPHGIEILTTVDYFAVGNRSNAYLNLSTYVAKHPEYTEALIDHLTQRKVGHWDSAVRHLTAKALHNLTHLAPEYTAGAVLPFLLKESLSSTLILRHGAILACGHVIYGLSLKAQEEGKALSQFVDEETLEKVYGIVNALEERKLFRGMGGEYMREATAVLIQKCCMAQIPLQGKPQVIDKWHSHMEDCVLNFEENIRTCALEALHALWVHTCQTKTDGDRRQPDVVDRYVQGLKCDRESQCLGYAAALGQLPKTLLSGKFSVVLEGLIKATQITSTTAKWALNRKEAINSIMTLINTVGITPDGDGSDALCRSSLEKVFVTLLNAMDDYTMDRRGDIGAWVREASMLAIKILAREVVVVDRSVLTPTLVSEMMTRLCQQSVERIDRSRKVAGTTFQSLLYSTPELPDIPEVENLRQIFPDEWCKQCNWASERSTYPKFVQVLDFDSYRPRVLLGLTYALGGVSANLSRYTLDALLTYLNERMDRQALLHGFVEALVQIFRKYEKDDRVTLPLIKSVSDLLGSCNAVDRVLEEDKDLLPKLLTCLKKECARCSDYHKLSATITTLCEMLRIQTTAKKSIITQVTIFLGYQYPKVRALTATSLLTAIMDYSDSDIVPEEHLDEVTSILEETPWMDSMDEARAQRNRVCQLIGVPAPQPKKV